MDRMVEKFGLRFLSEHVFEMTRLRKKADTWIDRVVYA